MDYQGYPRNDVLCIDMRSFYASVECMKRGLDPKKALLAVVGDTARRGSIVLAASPTLKRKYGISNVSRYFELPDDPSLIIAPAHMGDYLEVSVEITKMIRNYVPQQAIHVYSVDELWVTINGLNKLYGSPYEIAHMLQFEIREQFGIESVIGIGDNKFLAKVVMDIHAKKAEDGIAECRYEDVEAKLWPCDIHDVWGIGSRMTKNLNRMGILTLGDLARHPLKYLKKNFGVMGEQLYWHAWGIDLSPVYGNFVKTEQKSYGHGITLLRDYEKEEIYACLLDLCEEACRRARTDDKEGRTVHLGIGYSSETGGGFSRSMSVQSPTNITGDMYQVCLKLFQRFYDGKSKIRRASVALTNLNDGCDVQLSLFNNEPKKKDLADVMDRIRDEYGSTAVLRASSYTSGGITIERSKKIGGHYA
ncbi:UV damage repair protein UvrX [Halobacillus halophilus]|uniref:Probable UV-damage repair protein uvrX n=1 Tax=Halobacillus halophilus (strain ATCC 35676 / DSM 2266 / JCM 20832 / KCTC 3685 / LMG 17431 / NBRC 102448 / NCIMB 2269) TaxID=866895 RepID=I0JSF5_HALH3|nr:DNA polymerase IV [Halobacillus halophilus]ASF41016.1 UV damage repair protein UvrX [Halobacillus halophilus]CCG47077.1 probable UV-damage repair protein uvrX [Halobacillus halophilus DSM 2266]